MFGGLHFRVSVTVYKGEAYGFIQTRTSDVWTRLRTMEWERTQAKKSTWTRGWMGHVYNHLLPFVRPAGNPQHWSGFPALLLHLRKLFPGQPWLLEDSTQLSVLLKLLCEAFALLFLKAGQSCCFASLHYTISSSGLYLQLYAYNFYGSYLYQQFSGSSLFSCSLLKAQWHKQTWLYVRRILTAETSSSDG